MNDTAKRIISGGKTGPSGPGILYGAEVPEANANAMVAPAGSFYLNSATLELYGPKTAEGDWGLPTSLVATVTPTAIIGAIQSMTAEEITTLRAVLGFSTHANRAAANLVLENGDSYFDLSQSRVKIATD